MSLDQNSTILPHIRYFVVVTLLGICGGVLLPMLSSSPCPMEVRIVLAYLFVSFFAGWGFIDEYLSNPRKTVIKVKGDSYFVAGFLLSRLVLKLFKVIAAVAIGIIVFPYTFIKHVVLLIKTQTNPS